LAFFLQCVILFAYICVYFLTLIIYFLFDINNLKYTKYFISHNFNKNYSTVKCRDSILYYKYSLDYVHLYALAFNFKNKIEDQERWTYLHYSNYQNWQISKKYTTAYLKKIQEWYNDVKYLKSKTPFLPFSKRYIL
jgi:hypothetical protein